MPLCPPPDDSITFIRQKYVDDDRVNVSPKTLAPFVTPKNQIDNWKFQSTKQLTGPNPEELHFKLAEA